MKYAARVNGHGKSFSNQDIPDMPNTSHLLSPEFLMHNRSADLARILTSAKTLG